MSGKRTLYFPDEVWDRITDAAAQAGAKERRPVSVSEYLRRAAAEKMSRDKRKRAAL